MTLQLIQNQEDLNKIVQELLYSKVIGMDTEFIRRKTYFAKLSIIQIVTSGHKIIIDTLSISDLSPLKEILYNDNIVKILHAPQEDIRIFYNIFKKIPQNIFDTQIAASVCHIGSSISYSALCKEICNVTIDKTQQTANWFKRPLSDAMLEYAIRDAEYLEEIYIALNKIMADHNLQAEFESRMSTLLEVQQYTINSENAWKRIKIKNHSNTFKNRLHLLAAFREECASALDIPRQYFLTDEDLIAICEDPPRTSRALSNLETNTKALILPKYKAKLLELCIGIS